MKVKSKIRGGTRCYPIYGGGPISPGDPPKQAL
jgi:hypothetical protein